MKKFALGASECFLTSRTGIWTSSFLILEGVEPAGHLIEWGVVGGFC